MIGDKVLEGEKVRLRPVREEDLPSFQRWLNDLDVFPWLDLSAPPTWEDEEAWFQRMQAEPNVLVWAMETHSRKLLGNISIRFDMDNQVSYLGIFIGDKALWNQGYGTDAVRTLLRYAFREMGMHRMELRVDENNARAIRCYEKCGFVREGLMREDRLRQGEFHNSLRMGILRHEFLTGVAK